MSNNLSYYFVKLWNNSLFLSSLLAYQALWTGAVEINFRLMAVAAWTLESV